MTKKKKKTYLESFAELREIVDGAYDDVDDVVGYVNALRHGEDNAQQSAQRTAGSLAKIEALRGSGVPKHPPLVTQTASFSLFNGVEMKTWYFRYDDEYSIWAMFVSDGSCFIGNTKGECVAQFFEQN